MSAPLWICSLLVTNGSFWEFGELRKGFGNGPRGLDGLIFRAQKGLGGDVQSIPLKMITAPCMPPEGMRGCLSPSTSD